MRTDGRRLWKVVATMSVLLVTSLLICGCAGGTRSAVELGPKPSLRAAEGWKSQAVDDLRAWLGNVTPQQADQLEQTGVLTTSYQEIKSSDPAHAQIVDTYVEGLRSSIAEKARAKGFTLPQSDPLNVSFVKSRTGGYEFDIEFTDGSTSSLPLALPH